MKYLDDFFDFLSLLKENSSIADKKVIIITGIPRSGTTWFGDMLNTKGNIVFHEPFIKYTKLWNWELDYYPADTESINSQLRSIMTLKDFKKYQKKRTPDRFLKSTIFHKMLSSYLLKDKFNLVIKDPSIGYFANYFLEEFPDIKIFGIFRDPLSIVSSLARLNWDPTIRIEIIFHYNPYLKNNLPEHLKNWRELSMIQRMALQTALLHKLMQGQNIELLSYEHAASNPIEFFKTFYDRCNLIYDESVENRHYTYSVGKTPSNFGRHETKRNSREHVKIYKERLSVSEIDEVLEIYGAINSIPKFEKKQDNWDT